MEDNTNYQNRQQIKREIKKYVNLRVTLAVMEQLNLNFNDVVTLNYLYDFIETRKMRFAPQEGSRDVWFWLDKTDLYNQIGCFTGYKSADTYWDGVINKMLKIKYTDSRGREHRLLQRHVHREATPTENGKNQTVSRSYLCISWVLLNFVIGDPYNIQRKDRKIPTDPTAKYYKIDKTFIDDEVQTLVAAGEFQPDRFAVIETKPVIIPANVDTWEHPTTPVGCSNPPHMGVLTRPFGCQYSTVIDSTVMDSNVNDSTDNTHRPPLRGGTECGEKLKKSTIQKNIVDLKIYSAAQPDMFNLYGDILCQIHQIQTTEGQNPNDVLDIAEEYYDLASNNHQIVTEGDKKTIIGIILPRIAHLYYMHHNIPYNFSDRESRKLGEILTLVMKHGPTLADAAETIMCLVYALGEAENVNDYTLDTVFNWYNKLLAAGQKMYISDAEVDKQVRVDEWLDTFARDYVRLHGTPLVRTRSTVRAIKQLLRDCPDETVLQDRYAKLLERVANDKRGTLRLTPNIFSKTINF